MMRAPALPPGLRVFGGRYQPGKGQLLSIFEERPSRAGDGKRLVCSAIFRQQSPFHQRLDGLPQVVSGGVAGEGVASAPR